jgi:hypothetical protein
MIYLAFSKFGQLRISAKPEFKTPLGLQCYSVREWGLIVVLEYFRAYLSLVRQWPKEELLKQLRKL